MRLYSRFAIVLVLAMTWLSAGRLGAQDSTQDTRCHSCPTKKARWVAALPFGAGQFQNGDVEVGVALLITETALLGGSGSLYALHEGLREQHPDLSQFHAARAEETALRWGNWICAGLFAGVAVAGIVHAQLRFGDAGSVELTPTGAFARLDF